MYFTYIKYGLYIGRPIYYIAVIWLYMPRVYQTRLLYRFYMCVFYVYKYTYYIGVTHACTVYFAYMNYRQNILVAIAHHLHNM